MPSSLTRRAFLTAALSCWGAGRARATAAGAAFRFIQYHNQPEASPLHRRLVEMWAAIRVETSGRVMAEVFPTNNGINGSDPAALRALIAGDIQFFTLMGGILGTVVPAAEVQQVPFFFRSAAHAQHAMDGPLGAYLRREMAAKGIVGFAGGVFDNGMRQVAGTRRPIARPDDLAGLRMRVPAGPMVGDFFRTLGAEPIVVNSDSIYGALQTGRVDAQENPLALVELFKLDDVVRYVSMTNHMWSGFNLLAHQPTWTRLPSDLRAVVERNVVVHVGRQRRDQSALNSRAGKNLAGRGLSFNDVDSAPFRERLAPFYARWKDRLGSRCWSLLRA
jgi:tripartite ATP-independent transporter DctP family solute receptor